MKINEIKRLLMTSGVNSKHQVVEMLDNASVEEWLELRQDINEIIRNMRGLDYE